MTATAEEFQCPYYDLCVDCHPEEEMVEFRKKCDDSNCHYCGIYWAFQDGFSGLDD